MKLSFDKLIAVAVRRQLVKLNGSDNAGDCLDRQGSWFFVALRGALFLVLGALLTAGGYWSLSRGLINEEQRTKNIAQRLLFLGLNDQLLEAEGVLRMEAGQVPLHAGQALHVLLDQLDDVSNISGPTGTELQFD